MKRGLDALASVRAAGAAPITRAARVALLALAAFALAPAPARAQYQVIETRDLRLIYPGPTLGYLAPYTARCFENAMRFHKPLWDWEPSEKVNVILDDFTDFGNAGVWASPRNSMVVHIAPVNFVYETGPSNERMNFTMNHEVVHVAALDRAAGSDRLFRGLFHGKVREVPEHPETILYGWLTLPRRGVPRWYHEGIAVFLETWMAGGLGRAQGPYDEMVFRAMTRDGAHFYDPLGLEAEGTKVDFQVGVNSYLYGSRFITWLAWQHSPERVMEWVARRDGSRKYFANQFQAVFGKSLNDAWDEWIAWEQGFQRANLDSIRRHPVTGARDLSSRPLGSVSRAHWDAASRSIVAGVYYPGRVAHIAAIPVDGGAPRFLDEVKGPALYFVSATAFDPASRTLFYTADNNAWRDLYALDLASGKSRRLIKDARLGDLAFNRADRSLWGVRHFNGASTVVRLEPPYREWRQVHSFTYGRDVYDLDLSPDGKWLSASMAEVSGRQTLRLFDAAAFAGGDSSSRTLYDFGAAIPASFVFTPDGRHLYGSSYYTGVSNIFRYDLAADSMDVVSNVEAGLFRPLPTGEDSLIVFRYTGQGFVPAKIDPRPLTDVSAVTYLGARIVEKHPVLKSWRVPPPSRVPLDTLITYRGPYRPLASVRPTTVYPIVQAYKRHVAIGGRLNLSDPVTMHEFTVDASVSPQERIEDDERVHLALGYKRWDLKLRAQWNPASFYDLVGPRFTSRKGYGASAIWTRTLVRDDPRHLELNAGVSGWGGLEILPDNQNVEVSPGFDKLVDANLNLAYRNLRASIGALDHERGWKGELDLQLNNVLFDRVTGTAWESFPFVAGALDAGTPVPLPNSSLWLRTAAGWSPSDRDEPFGNFFFGGFGNNWLDWQEPRRYREWSSFPGVEFDAVAGTTFGRAMLDWNLPPLRFRKLGTLALYGSSARTSLFGGGIVANFDDDDSRAEVAHAGFQTDVRFQLLTQQPLTLSFGYARAWPKGARWSDEWMVSLKVL